MMGRFFDSREKFEISLVMRGFRAGLSTTWREVLVLPARFDSTDSDGLGALPDY